MFDKAKWMERVEFLRVNGDPISNDEILGWLEEAYKEGGSK